MVVIWDVLEHLHNYQFVLMEIKRVLRPNGLLALTTPNRHSIDCILYGKDYWYKRDKTHIHCFSRKELKYLLKTTGFSQIRIRTIQLLHFLPNIKKYSKRFEKQEKIIGKNKRLVTSANNQKVIKRSAKWIYNILDNLSTPFGANFYVFSVKQ